MNSISKLLKNLHQGCILTDKKGAILYTNTALAYSDARFTLEELNLIAKHVLKHETFENDVLYASILDKNILFLLKDKIWTTEIAPREKFEGILQAVTNLHENFSSVDKKSLFLELLKYFLQYSGSEYGFVGDVLFDEKLNPYLKTIALTDISWNEETKALFQIHERQGLEFRNLKTIFGHTLVNSVLTISNDPKNDPRSGGLAHGHPPLRAFMGIPIIFGKKMIAMVGLANKKGGYSFSCYQELLPLISTCSSLIVAYEEMDKQKATVRKLENNILALNNSEDGIAILDSEGKFTFLNQQHISIFGYSSGEELLGKHWSVLYDSDELERFEKDVFPDLGKNKFWSGTARAKKKSNDKFDEELTLSLLPDGGLVCICRDMTNLNLLKSDLNEANRLSLIYRNALDQATIISISDKNGRILHVNDEFCKISKYERKELIGFDHSVIRSECHDISFYKSLWSTILQGKIWRGEIKNKAKTGEFYWVYTQIIPVFDDKNKIDRFLSISSDITERKRYETLTQEMYSRLEVIVSSIPSAIVVEDESGNVAAINSNFKKIFKIDRTDDDVVGKPCSNLAIDSLKKGVIDQGQIDSIIEIVSSGQKVIAQKLKLGDNFFLRDYIPIYKDAKRIGNFWQYTDVTESVIRGEQLLRAKEKAVKASKAKTMFLSNMSHELRTPLNAMLGMTNVLADTKLDSEQKEFVEILKNSGENLLLIINDILDLTKIEEGKMRLNYEWFNLYELLMEEVKIWSIPIRRKKQKLNLIFSINPLEEIFCDAFRLKQILTNLIGNAHKFTNEGGEIWISCSKEKNDYLFSVRDNGSGISEKFLDKLFTPFLQEDSSENKNYEGTGLGLAISKRLVNLLKGDIFVESQKNKGSEFKFNIKAKPRLSESAKIIKSKMLLVLPSSKNLNWMSLGASNIKTVSLNEFALDGLYDDQIIVFSLSTESISEFKEIYEKFIFKYPNSLRRVFILVEQGIDHSIFINKNSIYFGSLTFKTLIDIDKIFHQGRGGKVDNVSQDKDFRKKVLIVDDVFENRFVLKNYFKGFDFDLVEALDGEDAVSRCLEQDFDLIFMDIQMPNLNGYEAIKMIRSIEKRKQSGQSSYIVALSGYTLKSQIKKCLNSGADSHMAKPLRKEELLSLIENLNVEATFEEVSVDPDLVDLLPQYINNRTKDLEALGVWIKENNFLEIESVGHKLKGHARSYGFPNLERIGTELEKAAAKRNKKIVSKMINDFRAVLATIKSSA
jgi:PAS domain S-box-containing protein